MKFRSIRLAQQELSEQLENLIAQLRSIEDIQQTSPQFDTYVHKLINIKHKVTVVYSILQGAQVGLFDKMHCPCLKNLNFSLIFLHFIGSIKSNTQAN